MNNNETKNNETVKNTEQTNQTTQDFPKEKEPVKEETVQEILQKVNLPRKQKRKKFQKTKMTLLINILAWMSTCYKNGWQN